MYDIVLCSPWNFISNTQTNILHLPLTKIKSYGWGRLKQTITKNYDIGVLTSKSVIFCTFSLDRLPVKRIICIGPSTARVFYEHYPKSNKVYVPPTYNALAVAEWIIQHVKGKSVLWLGGRNGIKTGIELLRDQLYSVDIVDTHQSCFLDRKTIENSIKHLVELTPFIEEEKYWVLTSPSSAMSYIRNGLYRKQHHIACLGKETQSTLLQNKITPYYVARHSTLDHLLSDISCLMLGYK